jgi:hypothetical protein
MAGDNDHEFSSENQIYNLIGDLPNRTTDDPVPFIWRTLALERLKVNRKTAGVFTSRF